MGHLHARYPFIYSICQFYFIYLNSCAQVTSIPLTADIDYVVIGCDGLYDEMSDDDIVAFINDGLAHEKDLIDIAKDLVEEAIDLGSTDNVSVIIVKLDKKFQRLITKSAQLEVSISHHYDSDSDRPRNLNRQAGRSATF